MKHGLRNVKVFFGELMSCAAFTVPVLHVGYVVSLIVWVILRQNESEGDQKRAQWRNSLDVVIPLPD